MSKIWDGLYLGMTSGRMLGVAHWHPQPSGNGALRATSGAGPLLIVWDIIGIFVISVNGGYRRGQLEKRRNERVHCVL